MKNETKNKTKFLAIHNMLNDVKNEINKKYEQELIVINNTDGFYYTYCTESIIDLFEIYLDDCILNDAQNYTDKVNDIISVLRTGSFWDFIITDVLQHSKENSYYAFVNGHIYNEVAGSGNE